MPAGQQSPARWSRWQRHSEPSARVPGCPGAALNLRDFSFAQQLLYAKLFFQKAWNVLVFLTASCNFCVFFGSPIGPWAAALKSKRAKDCAAKLLTAIDPILWPCTHAYLAWAGVGCKSENWPCLLTVQAARTTWRILIGFF